MLVAALNSTSGSPVVASSILYAVIHCPSPTALADGETEIIITVANNNSRLKARILFFNLNPLQFFYYLIHITLVLIRLFIRFKKIFSIFLDLTQFTA
jgi:hypothetical protein